MLWDHPKNFVMMLLLGEDSVCACVVMPSSSGAAQFEDEDDLEEVVLSALRVHTLRREPWSVRMWS